MGSAQITEALASLSQSSRILSSLSFAPLAVLPQTVLSSEDAFETHLIRDAAPHELALFEPNDPTNDPVIAVDAFEGAGIEGERWVAAKRAGPKRAGGVVGRPSPLKERRATTARGGGATDPDRCLRAAKKLLDVYTMPRAQEHVEALHSQWAGIIDTISSLEDTLRRPPSRSAPQPSHDSSYFRQLELEDLIKREKLEVFALEQLKAEKEAELAALSPPAPSSRPSAPSTSASSTRPDTAQDGKPTRRVPSVVARARGGLAQPSSTSRRSLSSSPQVGKNDNKLEESTIASQLPPPDSLTRTGVNVALPSSPARRPIGAREKRVSLVGAGRARTSLGRKSLGFAGAVPPTEQGQVDAKQEDTEAEGEKTPTRPLPSVPSPHRFPPQVTQQQVDIAVKAVWAGLGLGGWKARWEREGREGGAGEKEEEWRETIAILRYGISSSLAAASAASSNGPSSPSSHSITSFSTSTTGGDSSDPSNASPTPWTPSQIVEAQLCNLLLSSICGVPLPSSPSSSSLPALTLIFRDSVLPVPSTSPHLPFTALKSHLGHFARAQEWTEEMGTTAVYSLVGRQVVKIDRRGREGAAKKAPSSIGGGGGSQSTLLSFFSKPAPSSSSSSHLASSSPATARKPLAKPKSMPVKKGEVVTLESSDVEAEPNEEEAKVKVPSKRPAPAPKPKSPLPPSSTAVNDASGSGSDSDEAVSAARRKRPSLGRGVKGGKGVVVDSEEEDEEDVKPLKKAATSGKSLTNGKGKAGANKSKKQKKGGDDDDFAASSTAGEDSDDYFDDGLDDALANLSDSSSHSAASSSSTPPPKSKTKAKAAPKKAAPMSRQTSLGGFGAGARPQLKSAGSGSGGIGGIKTAAETAREKAKQDKQSNEEMFSFLVDPKDIDGNRPGEPGYDPRTLYIPPAAWKQFTPFEHQFWEIKRYHYDTVLFFQKGKFFELYEEDAAIGHREFDLKLTDRVKMKMVGVPETSFDFWAAKFLAQGYKVGRVDQCETALGAELRNKDDKKAGKTAGKAKQAKGKEIVRRELKSVLTSGTIVDGSMLTDDMSNHCVAIKEHTPTPMSPPSFGVCVLDASTAEFSLSFFTDDASRTELETLVRQLKPKELIHQKGNLSVSTLRLLRNCLGLECQWTALKEGKEFLNAEDAKDEVVKLFVASTKGGAGEGDEEEMEVDGQDDEDVVPESIRKMYDKPVAMSALGGMIWYLRQLNLDADLVTARNFNIYDPLGRSNGTLILDGQTLAHIEVLQNSQGTTEGTLLQLLSRCVTPFGKRLFKVWLCAPLRDATAINDRLDAVEDLLGNANFAVAFDGMAKKLPDLERMLSRVHGKTCKKKDFIAVIEAFERITTGLKTLGDLSEDFKSQGIPDLIRSVPDVSELLEEMQGLYIWDEEAGSLHPADGKDEDFERVRQKVDEVEEELQQELRSARKSLKCPDAIFKHIGTKDIFQLEVPVKVKVPNNWTKMSGTQKVHRYYSPEIARLVAQLKEARERMQMVVNDFQFKLYGEFDKHYTTWMTVIRAVSQLDCLLSLSKSSAALGEPCVRPEIVESDTAIVEFEELRHPCILSASTDFIPNDVVLGGEAKNLMLLTGPNSTLLRMACTAVIMAQLGCFVPAASARIAPIDAIYSRMGANDFIFANASTFKVEMDDCNKILQKATPRSLVILDELGRGTSTYDGMAIAYAVLHRLATHMGCIGFFATHFTSLTEDFATSVNDETREVVFLYKLIDGSSPKSYGPHVAAMAGLSESIVERAIAISKQFEETSRARELAMRANETLPLTAQADAAFLIKLAKLKLADGKYTGDTKQLLRTLDIVRKAVGAIKETRAAA
ncbi:DNA mismatch repair protein msh6 [Rhodotorula toruloides]|nr:DNA mismatch repair protein msh6 [Rhodotorula toruloides]